VGKKIWGSDKVSIILLPSGDLGRSILDLAQDWTRSWLLTPALWMLADEVPDFDPSLDSELQVPPNLKAYLLGRDQEQNAVREEVDVFWTLGSQPFKIVRFIAVRTEQSDELMRKTNLAAETSVKFISRATPEISSDAQKVSGKSNFKKYNLVISPTNDRSILEGVILGGWDANLIAAAEDRSTPLSTDSFVKVGERFVGFALAHIATTAGLWAGLDSSSAEIQGLDPNQLRQACLQRVFVRGVTSDTLSADVAHWALHELNFSDSDLGSSSAAGPNAKTVPAEFHEQYMNDLVDYILAGPTTSKDNFLYSPFVGIPYGTVKAPLFIRLLERIGDMGSGLAGLPRWARATAEYRMDLAMDDEADEQTLYKGVPQRLAPKIKLQPVDVLVASQRQRLPMPASDLWRHMRTAISSAIDAPTSEHPVVLTDPVDGKKWVFASVDQVLPDPDALWSPKELVSGTKTEIKAGISEVRWLDAETAHLNIANIYNRIDELAPGIIDARNQLAETQKLVNDAIIERDAVIEDLDFIQTELLKDQQDAKKISNNHTHKLPRALTDTAKRRSEGGKSSKKFKPTHGKELEDFLDEENEKLKVKFWHRIFRRKGRSKK